MLAQLHGLLPSGEGALDPAVAAALGVRAAPGVTAAEAYIFVNKMDLVGTHGHAACWAPRATAPQEWIRCRVWHGSATLDDGVDTLLADLGGAVANECVVAAVKLTAGTRRPTARHSSRRCATATCSRTCCSNSTRFWVRARSGIAHHSPISRARHRPRRGRRAPPQGSAPRRPSHGSSPLNARGARRDFWPFLRGQVADASSYFATGYFEGICTESTDCAP